MRMGGGLFDLFLKMVLVELKPSLSSSSLSVNYQRQLGIDRSGLRYKSRTNDTKQTIKNHINKVFGHTPICSERKYINNHLKKTS